MKRSDDRLGGKGRVARRARRLREEKIAEGEANAGVVLSDSAISVAVTPFGIEDAIPLMEGIHPTSFGYHTIPLSDFDPVMRSELEATYKRPLYAAYLKSCIVQSEDDGFDGWNDYNPFASALVRTSILGTMVLYFQRPRGGS